MELQVKNSNDKPIHALVTGVGAIIGYGIIKSLRQSGLPTVSYTHLDVYKRQGRHEHIQRKTAWNNR